MRISDLRRDADHAGGPVGYRALDTTALAEGQHTIAWVFSDDRGAAAGMGSRFFSVANSANAQPASQSGATAASTADAHAGVRLASPSLAIAPGARPR
jgi:hypothetical protein